MADEYGLAHPGGGELGPYRIGCRLKAIPCLGTGCAVARQRGRQDLVVGKVGSDKLLPDSRAFQKTMQKNDGG
jgi:hypothetical protein